MTPGFTSQTDGFEDAPLEGGTASDIIDEEELVKLREMKDLKRQYRDLYSKLRDCRSEMTYSQQAIDSNKQRLVGEFEEWYADTFAEEGTGVSALEGMGSARGTMEHSKQTSGANSPQKLVRDPEMDEDLNEEDGEEREGVDIDNNALAYIRSRKNVLNLAKARKNK